jgi:DNA-binding GntR family transcriptional regulator
MPEPHLQQIENKPLREKILDMLRDAIIHGEIKPGQPLVEIELAGRLGVSRAPLREAIQTLSAEGLVETVPYKGSVVRLLTRRDIEELYSLRAALETFAIQRIIAHINQDALLQLRACFADMLMAAEADDIKQVNEIDRQFHDLLIELSDHHLLAMSWNNVSMRVRQVMALRNRRNSDLTQIAYNHLPIIEAIADCDETRAIRLIQQHVASAGDLVAENWDTEDTPS